MPLEIGHLDRLRLWMVGSRFSILEECILSCHGSYSAAASRAAAQLAHAANWVNRRGRWRRQTEHGWPEPSAQRL